MLARLEKQAKLLALVKLANVALAMLWGFAVTFVFVRLLPLSEFKAFLLLVAFANFTISADFGFSGIIYARLRRFRLRQGAADPFNPAEIVMLLAFMLLVVALGGLAIALCLASGFIPTQWPALFMGFYILSVLNIIALLAKRALAALDHNLLWEGMDFVRRSLSIGLLLAALAGLPILLSVCLQIGLTVAALFAGLAVVHRAIGMQARQWLLARADAGRVFGQYARDMGATMGLTLSDVAAYNAPYLGIALATHDPRPLLVFDFLFKISRALSAAIRALVEAGLPRLTAAYHAGRHEAARASIGKLSVLALACAAALGLLLLLAGPDISRIMFDGKVVLGRDELLFMTALLAGLAMICVSTYVQNGLGRFGALLPASLAFLAGSVASVPVAAWLAPLIGASFSLCFIAAYALVHLLLGLRHHLMLRGIARA
jgi:hypothetical protein